MIKYGLIAGSAVCSIKYKGLEGVKLLLVRPVNRRMEFIGSIEVAADVNQAGVGDLCILTKSHEASMTLENQDVPVDLATVGIIDKFFPPVGKEEKLLLNYGENIFT